MLRVFSHLCLPAHLRRARFDRSSARDKISSGDRLSHQPRGLSRLQLHHAVPHLPARLAAGIMDLWVRPLQLQERHHVLRRAAAHGGSLCSFHLTPDQDLESAGKCNLFGVTFRKLLSSKQSFIASRHLKLETVVLFSIEPE